jgi:hypothetical protein
MLEHSQKKYAITQKTFSFYTFAYDKVNDRVRHWFT